MQIQLIINFLKMGLTIIEAIIRALTYIAGGSIIVAAAV